MYPIDFFWRAAERWPERIAIDAPEGDTSYALLAQRMQVLFRSPSAARWQNRFFGGLLMAVGATLAFVKRAAP